VCSNEKHINFRSLFSEIILGIWTIEEIFWQKFTSFITLLINFRKGLLCIKNIRSYFNIFIQFLILGADENESEYLLDGIDGPYIFNHDSTVLVYAIDQKNKLTFREASRSDTFEVMFSNETNDTFSFTLQDSLKIYPAYYPLVSKYSQSLISKGISMRLWACCRETALLMKITIGLLVTDILVINGDLVDRGEFVTQVLWLLYKLEQQALAQNGMVHVILGKSWEHEH